MASGSLSIGNSTISGNEILGRLFLPMDAEGGGIYQAGGALAVSNTTFASDDAVSDGGLAAGDALYAEAGTTTIQNCTFNNDSATGTQGFGGAIYGASSGSVTISSKTSFVYDTTTTDGDDVYFAS